MIDQIKPYLTKNLDTYMDMLYKMVSINSFTLNVAGVNKLGAYTSDLFRELGFISEEIQAANELYGNHIFLCKAANKSKLIDEPPTLALISHLDTVFSKEEESKNNFNWHQIGDRIYGPGTVDIKGGTIMIYMVLDAIKYFHPDLYDSVNWLIALDSCEEALSDDFSTQCLERLPNTTKACLVFEGGSIFGNEYKIVTSRKGRATFYVEVTGRSAHAGNAHQSGANAITQIASTVQKIASLTDYDKEITFNVGTIEGGTVVNRVPENANASVEMRAFSIDVFENGIKSILDLQKSADVTSLDGYFCVVSVNLLDQLPPWPYNPNTEKLFSIWSSVGAKLGFKIIKESRGGLSDGNLLSNHFPTIDGLGPAGGNAHCSVQSEDGSKEQEFVLKSSFVNKACLNIFAIGSLLKRNFQELY